jgi:hypothetical protein
MKLSKFQNIQIINAFKHVIESYGWNIGRLLDDLVIQHGNFHFVINSADELVKVIDMFSCIPAQKTRDEWHEKAKKQLKSVENAKRLLADFKSPIACKYDHMGDIMADNHSERLMAK